LVKSAIGTLGENMQIGRVMRMNLGE